MTVSSHQNFLFWSRARQGSKSKALLPLMGLTQSWVHALRSVLLTPFWRKEPKQLNKVCSPCTFYYRNCQHQPHTVCLFFPCALWARWHHLNHDNSSLGKKQRARWAVVSFHKRNLSPRFNKTQGWSVHGITPTFRLKDKGAMGNEKNKTTVATKESKSRKPKRKLYLSK